MKTKLSIFFLLSLFLGIVSAYAADIVNGAILAAAGFGLIAGGVVVGTLIAGSLPFAGVAAVASAALNGGLVSAIGLCTAGVSLGGLCTYVPSVSRISANDPAPVYMVVDTASDLLVSGASGSPKMTIEINGSSSSSKDIIVNQLAANAAGGNPYNPDKGTLPSGTYAGYSTGTGINITATSLASFIDQRLADFNASIPANQAYTLADQSVYPPIFYAYNYQDYHGYNVWKQYKVFVTSSTYPEEDLSYYPDGGWIVEVHADLTCPPGTQTLDELHCSTILSSNGADIVQDANGVFISNPAKMNVDVSKVGLQAGVVNVPLKDGRVLKMQSYPDGTTNVSISGQFATSNPSGVVQTVLASLTDSYDASGVSNAIIVQVGPSSVTNEIPGDDWSDPATGVVYGTVGTGGGTGNTGTGNTGTGSGSCSSGDCSTETTQLANKGILQSIKDFLTGDSEGVDPVAKTGEDLKTAGGLSSSFTNILGWRLPPHQSECPALSIDWDIAGSHTAIRETAHCTLFTNNAGIISNIFLAFYSIGALFIVLKA